MAFTTYQTGTVIQADWLNDVNAVTYTGEFPDGVAPKGPTAPNAANDTRLATTQFVKNVITANVTGVTSVNGRSGAVVLGSSDITGALGFTPFSTTGVLGIAQGGTGQTSIAGYQALLQGDGRVNSAVGFRNIPQNSQSTNYTLVASDSGKHLFHPGTDTTARTFTIPANSVVDFPLGTTITFINQNAAGTLSIAINTDTMRLAGLGTIGTRTLAPNGIATAIKVTATEWIINGTGLT